MSTCDYYSKINGAEYERWKLFPFPPMMQIDKWPNNIIVFFKNDSILIGRKLYVIWILNTMRDPHEKKKPINFK